MKSNPLVLQDDFITALAKSYNILDYTPKLRKLATSAGFYTENFTKKELHKTINDVIYNNYKGEVTIKALLVQFFKNKNVTASFEIKVNSSRIDFLTINGETKSYEIKSELDNLSKLVKQTEDYTKVFEYNYIVIDEKHYTKAKEILPDGYGIIILRNRKLDTVREAKKNDMLCMEMQLNLFTQRELKMHFKNQTGNKIKIIKECTGKEINNELKSMLKKRYEINWSFLKNNLNNIFAIDYQYFFYHNIEPNIIYQAN